MAEEESAANVPVTAEEEKEHNPQPVEVTPIVVTNGLTGKSSNSSSAVATGVSSATPFTLSVDGDEPLPSGYGNVKNDCNQKELEEWSQLLSEWRSNPSVRPSQLPDLVRKGIPEPWRGEVWQLLTNCHNNDELISQYTVVLAKDCPDEMHVRRDIGRTFPAHEYFRETGSAGQEALYRVLRAYAVYDSDVGYCQGFSFIAAALLLHMPEENAFCVLVRIMHDYGLRYTLKDGFETLYLRFYQLDRFIEDQLPDLYVHFQSQHIEAHMYASQWFLTLFTAKFPLYVVYYILDIFLLDGTPVLFQVAISLLQLSKDHLLRLDFEGILKYFRIQLPKNYQSDEQARILLQLANSKKVKTQLISYEKAFNALRDQHKAKGETIKLMQKENKRLVLSNMRLEQENDDLARELTNSKIKLNKQLEQSQDKNEVLAKELQSFVAYNYDLEEERKQLLQEIGQLKDVCRREVENSEKEIARNNCIIKDYKKITSTLSERLETSQAEYRESIDKLTQIIKSCTTCNKRLHELTNQSCANGTNGEGQNVTEKSGPSQNGQNSASEQPPEGQNLSVEDSLKSRIRELELELAQTKLALVEAECINQDLVHSLNSSQMALQEKTNSQKNTWIHKTLSTIREARNNVSSSSGKSQKSSFSRENSREFNN